MKGLEYGPFGWTKQDASMGRFTGILLQVQAAGWKGIWWFCEVLYWIPVAYYYDEGGPRSV